MYLAVTGAGGIVGYCSSGAINTLNCYNVGAVNGSAGVGGIIGRSLVYGQVVNCFNSGVITFNPGEACGGIVGDAYNTNVMNCYNTGTINGGNYTGGVAGKCNSIVYCYNSGDVTGDMAGGIVGDGYDKSVVNCHNIGTIVTTREGRTDLCGEITGYYYDSGNKYINCTFLIKTANANSNGATGVNDMTSTMSIPNFIDLMNDYVDGNNETPSNPTLKTWTLKDGLPVLSN